VTEREEHLALGELSVPDKGDHIGNQVQSSSIKGNQGQSRAIKGIEGQSRAINGKQGRT
jgi:hypothetical protein